MTRICILTVLSVVLIAIGFTIGRMGRNVAELDDNGKCQSSSPIFGTVEEVTSCPSNKGIGDVAEPQTEVGLRRPAVDSVKAGMSNADASAYSEVPASLEVQDRIDDVRRRLEKLFSELDANGGGEAAELELVRELWATHPSLLLSAVRDMMRIGDGQEKRNALAVVNAVYGNSESPRAKDRYEAVGVSSGDEEVLSISSGQNQSGLTEDMADAGDEESVNSGEEEFLKSKYSEEEAMETKLIVDVVSEALNDSDAELRMAALDTLVSMRGDESCILASQLLCGNDADMKRHLLEAVADATDDRNVRINLQAFASDDSEVRALAAANLEKSFGQSFATVEDAEAWLSESAVSESASSAADL